MTFKRTDLSQLRAKGGSPAEINDIYRLDETISQRRLELSRLMDRRRTIVERIRMRHHQRIKRAK